MEGKFKSLEKVKKADEHINKPKFILICMGNVKDTKTRLVLSERAHVDQK